MLTIYEFDYCPRICGWCYLDFVGSSCQTGNSSVVNSDTVGVQQVDILEARWALASVYNVTISANLRAAPSSMDGVDTTAYGEKTCRRGITVLVSEPEHTVNLLGANAERPGCLLKML